MQTNFSLSAKLKRKLINELPSSIVCKREVDVFFIGGQAFHVPALGTIKANVSFSENEKELFNECVSWLHNFSEQKFNIKRFKGIFPERTEIHPILGEYKVVFNVDQVNEETWKDWFITDEDELEEI